MSKRLLPLLLISGALLMMAAAGCDDPPPPDDGGPDGGDGDADGDGDSDGDGDADADEDVVPMCESDDDCLDSIFCNGEETCDPDDSAADDFGCVPGELVDCDDSIEATTDTCSEERGACVHDCPDVDGDGHGDINCVDADGDPLGDDCDDEDVSRFPGNVEVCDLEGHDEDCDPSTVGSLDEDEDGFINDVCCNGEPDDEDYVCGTDCDDENRDVNTSATEVCDLEGVDEDCDGEANEDLTVLCLPDEDDDSFAAAGTEASETCPAPGRDHVGGCPSTTTNLEPSAPEFTDCDDEEAEVYPGAPELCNRRDEDCDGELSALPGELDETDRDGDGFLECDPDPDLRDCADDDDRAFPGATDYQTTPIRVDVVPVARPYDFDCNDVEELESAVHGFCDPTGGCVLREGWSAVDPPACGESADWVHDCLSSFPLCVPQMEARTAACR